MPLPFQETGMIIEYANGSELLIFDINTEASHERNAEITTSPVETNTDVVDHRRRLPISFRFTAMLLNEEADPLLADDRKVLGVGNDPSQLPTDLQPTPTRALELYETLLALHNGNEIFTAYTDLEVIQNAMLENFTSSLIGHKAGIEITGTIREVQFATTELGAVPQAEVRTSKKKKKKGTKSGDKSGTTSVKSQGILDKIGTSLGILAPVSP